MNELVEFNSEHNCGTTTSLQLAESFNRQHKTILAAINSLEVSQEFIEQNFLPYSYIAKNGKANPAYEITFDGFTLLAMGFTGKKAMEFKVKYIRAFRAMEAALKQNTAVSLTQDRAALKAIGGIVKKCAVAAFRDAILDVMKEAEQQDIFGEVKDDDLIRTIWGWYAGHHQKTFDCLRKLTKENDELKQKLLMIKQAVN